MRNVRSICFRIIRSQSFLNSRLNNSVKNLLDFSWSMWRLRRNMSLVMSLVGRMKAKKLFFIVLNLNNAESWPISTRKSDSTCSCTNLSNKKHKKYRKSSYKQTRASLNSREMQTLAPFPKNHSLKDNNLSKRKFDSIYNQLILSNSF